MSPLDLQLRTLGLELGVPDWSFDPHGCAQLALPEGLLTLEWLGSRLLLSLQADIPLDAAQKMALLRRAGLRNGLDIPVAVLWLPGYSGILFATALSSCQADLSAMARALNSLRQWPVVLEAATQ